MDTIISFTPGQIVALAAGISAICAAVGWVIKIVKRTQAPTRRLEERVAAIELVIKNHDDYLASDKRRLEAIEEGNRVTQKAILALLSHGIDGNDIDAMKDAKAELQKYLIER
ncbi:MAG: hypothetical protein J6Z30_06705 [Pyramidobacter sp.]|nr:hypothetical protein [Pyramidobacter sp.]